MLWGLLLSLLAVQDTAATAHSEAFRAWKSKGELNRCARRTAGRQIDFTLLCSFLPMRPCQQCCFYTNSQ